MEAGNSTTPSSASSGLPEAAPPALDLELPDGEGFRALPPCVSLEQLLRRNRELRRWFPEGLRTAEERWQAKTNVVFEL